MEFLRNSTILSQNQSYYDHLRKFLEPAVRDDSRWLLCYRASSSWLARTFHSRCDGKMNTVAIIKKDQFVFGGFTDIPWGKIVVSFPLSLYSFSFPCLIGSLQLANKSVRFRIKGNADTFVLNNADYLEI